MHDMKQCMHARWRPRFSQPAALPALASDQIFYTVFTFFDDLKLSHQGGGAPTRNPHTAPYAARFEAMFGTDNASHMMV